MTKIAVRNEQEISSGNKMKPRHIDGVLMK
jgi:hypothetical protein